ncbi:hypothetical protein CTH30272_02145 [Allocatenococcus thiocycli]|nr:hypothetical protein CTH30272_02145 [Catenococcus thiocycli]
MIIQVYQLPEWLYESKYIEITGLSKSQLTSLQQTKLVEGKHYKMISTTGRKNGRTAMYNHVEMNHFFEQESVT